MKIRQEKPAEYQAVERLTYQAFKELNLTENWRPTEHFIVHLLRESADFIPELSLVSETDQGKLTGHIMSSKAKLRLPDHTEKAVLTVGPSNLLYEVRFCSSDYFSDYVTGKRNIRSIIGFGITARLFWHKWWGVAFFNMLCLSRNTPCRIRSL